ncbi:MAG: non-ribosomal peptide synthetase, partial [Deltaproteobacteria bacterium]|nr:non-ribosomal peptide synthetase [Deltaproteobacteria bacterium]
QRLWFLDKLEGGNDSTYNIPMPCRVIGDMDISALNMALNEIIRRHEGLRTVFHDPVENSDDGQLREPGPVQLILPELKLDPAVTDISGLPRKEREGEAGHIAEEEGLKPFDLSKGPLIRAGIVRMGDREHLLLITVHHIVFDGWSADVFFREFRQLYEAFSAGKPSPLSDFEIQYADFAHWQRDLLSGETLEIHLDYWKKQLSGVPLLLELPADRPRPPVQTFNGNFIPFELSADLTGRVNELSHGSGVTLFMTLYAAFTALLSRYSGKEDIVMGSPIANRNHKQTEHLIGFFVNTLALRADISGDPAFTALLDQVKRTTLDAYEHQDLPFERLVDELDIERSMSHSPLFQVMF